MKKILLIVLFISGSFISSFAQLSQDDIALFQSIYGKDKREVVQQYMKFSETEAAAFWPLYDEYEAARKEIGKKRIQLLEVYAKNYNTLTDVTADNLMTDVIAQNEAMVKLQSKYYAKAKKIIPALKAAQFMQLETYMDNAAKVELSENIPFIGEIERD